MMWRGSAKLSIDITKINRAMDQLSEDPLNQFLWENSLIELTEAFRARGLNIIPFTEATNMSVMFTPSLSRGFEEYFDDGWSENDWHSKALPFLTQNGVVRDIQYTTRDEFELNQFYRFVRKHGVGHSAFIEWHLSTKDRLILAIHRKIGDDAFTIEEETILQALRRRFQDIGYLMYHLSFSKIRGAAEGLDIVTTPAIFFNRFCKVVYVNHSAQLLLGPDLQVSDGELLLRRDTEKLQFLMREIVAPFSLKPDTLLAPFLIEREDKPPLHLRIQRLPDNLPNMLSAAVGVLILSSKVMPKVQDTDFLLSRYGLSVQETAIALHLYDGLSAREIADKTSRSYETVRTHIKSLFQKTGTKRQGELLTLIRNHQRVD